VAEAGLILMQVQKYVSFCKAWQGFGKVSASQLATTCKAGNMMKYDEICAPCPFHVLFGFFPFFFFSLSLYLEKIDVVLNIPARSHRGVELKAEVAVSWFRMR